MSVILVIGGMDSSAGAGLARDLMVIRNYGHDARLCVTAVTAQGQTGVAACQPMPPDLIEAQILAAGPVDAVKTGMLADAAIVSAIARVLPNAPLVIDPVLRASAGQALIDADGQSAVIRDLLPRATVLTPNLPEAQALTGSNEPAEQAARLLMRGARSVLIKGGHAKGAQSVDRLYRPGQPPVPFAAPRLPGSFRGTGCTLATAIACGLADGRPLNDAVRDAKARLNRWLARQID